MAETRRPRSRISWHTAPIIASLAFRLGLFAFTSLPDSLENRIELSTPITNIRRLREGVYLHRHGIDPYEGSSFHHSPLLLSIFSTVLDPSSRLVTALFWTFIDFIAASALRSIWTARKSLDGNGEPSQWSTNGDVKHTNALQANASESGPKRKRSWLRDEWEESVMLLYLLNPYTIATCLARSTTSIDNALTFLSISYAAQGQAPLAMFFLSLAVHSQLYPLLLLVPICLVLLSVREKRYPEADTESKAMWWDMCQWVATFATFMGIDYGLAYLTVGSNQFIYQTWGTILSVSDLTPNVGLSWYFFTEMYDHFRKFFTGIFQLHVLLYVIPICGRLRYQPLSATLVLSGIISVFKSYPTLGDATVWLGLLGCFPDIWDSLRHPLLTASLFLYSTLLLPILLELWLVSATGNANFMYAATMVHSLGCGLGVLDVLGAALRNEVSELTVEFVDARGSTSADGPGTAKEKIAVSDPVPTEVLKSAKCVLEDRNLVVVQYTTLDEA